MEVEKVAKALGLILAIVSCAGMVWYGGRLEEKVMDGEGRIDAIEPRLDEISEKLAGVDVKVDMLIQMEKKNGNDQRGADRPRGRARHGSAGSDQAPEGPSGQD